VIRSEKMRGGKRCEGSLEKVMLSGSWAM